MGEKSSKAVERVQNTLLSSWYGWLGIGNGMRYHEIKQWKLYSTHKC